MCANMTLQYLNLFISCVAFRTCPRSFGAVFNFRMTSYLNVKSELLYVGVSLGCIRTTWASEPIRVWARLRLRAMIQSIHTCILGFVISRTSHLIVGVYRETHFHMGIVTLL